MKKLALAVGLGAYVAFGASSGSLAAYRADTASGVATNADSRIAWSAGTTASGTDRMFCDGDIYLVA